MNNLCSHNRSVFAFCNDCEWDIPEADKKVARAVISHQPANPSDAPESPSYYKRGKIEVIDFIEDQKLDFRAANVIKYICRFPYKGKALADLKKAAWYVNRLIEEEEKNCAVAE